MAATNISFGIKRHTSFLSSINSNVRSPTASYLLSKFVNATDLSRRSDGPFIAESK